MEGICRVIPKIPEGIDNVDGNYPTNQSSAPYAIFNIGCGRPLKLMDYIRELEAALNKKAKINFMPMQAGDVHNTHASIENLSKEIGYHPVVGIKEGIQAFISWYLKYHGIKLDEVRTCH